MHFKDPQCLFLLALPCMLALWTLLKPGAVVNAPVADRVLVRQPVTALLVKAGMLLPSLMLACFIFILAGPYVNRQVVNRKPVQTTNIEILLNASRSMLARGEIGFHCRYCASKTAIGNFVKKRGGNTMGISLFGSSFLSVVPLTPDLNCITTSIDRTFPDFIAFKIAHEKNFAEGIAGSIKKLTKSATQNSDQILILVTDGENEDLSKHEEELRKSLEEADVTLYVAMIAETSNARTLARLAQSSRRGRLFECKDLMGFEEVMREIDRMNKIAYLPSDTSRRPVDNNEPFALALAGFSALFACYLATPFRLTPW